jgi:hypothetical protein
MDHDAKMHSAMFDDMLPFIFFAIEVTNATVPDSKDEVGDVCMFVIGKMDIDKFVDVDEPEFSEDDDSSEDKFDCSSCSNEWKGNRPVAMVWADFKSTQTMVPSWHMAKRIERGDVMVLPMGVVAVALIAVIADDIVLVVVVVAAEEEDIAGMEQIAVMPQTEMHFGFVATAGETGGASTTTL